METKVAKLNQQLEFIDKEAAKSRSDASKKDDLITSLRKEAQLA